MSNTKSILFNQELFHGKVAVGNITTKINLKVTFKCDRIKDKDVPNRIVDKIHKLDLGFTEPVKIKDSIVFDLIGKVNVDSFRPTIDKIIGIATEELIDGYAKRKFREVCSIDKELELTLDTGVMSRSTNRRDLEDFSGLLLSVATDKRSLGAAGRDYGEYSTFMNAMFVDMNYYIKDFDNIVEFANSEKLEFNAMSEYIENKSRPETTSLYFKTPGSSTNYTVTVPFYERVMVLGTVIDTPWADGRIPTASKLIQMTPRIRKANSNGTDLYKSKLIYSDIDSLDMLYRSICDKTHIAKWFTSVFGIDATTSGINKSLELLNQVFINGVD